MNRKANKNDNTHKTSNCGNSTSKRGRTKRTQNGDIDDTDNTSHLADPPDEVNLREVQLPKPVPNVKQHDLAPVRGGTMLDLDAEQITSYIDDGQQDEIEEDQLEHRSNLIIVPSYTSWFDYTSVHPIERRAMPEFFNNLKFSNSNIYISTRNYIIDAYRLNPMEYLSVTTCSRCLNFDISAIVKIHAFLEQWGLINYHVEPELKPAPLGPPPTNHFHLLAETSSSFKPLGPDGRISKRKSNHVISLQVFNPKNREDNDTNHDKELLTEEERKTKYSNYGLRLDDYYLHNINFQTRGASRVSRDWTESETLALLEAIELYKDDWHKVCEHVGSRTQDECILHFLQLPIEDPYLIEDDAPATASDNDQYQPIPFSKSANPIMSTIAFLASAVDPSVAASAAKAALTEFSNLAEDEHVVAADKVIDEKCLSSAASCALKAAASKANYLASIEERKIKSLVSVLIDTQLKKLGIKIQHFEELETLIDKEKEAIDNQRKQLAKEQREFQEEQVRAEKFRAGQIKVENMINPNPPT